MQKNGQRVEAVAQPIERDTGANLDLDKLAVTLDDEEDGLPGAEGASDPVVVLGVLEAFASRGDQHVALDEPGPVRRISGHDFGHHQAAVALLQVVAHGARGACPFPDQLEDEEDQYRRYRAETDPLPSTHPLHSEWSLQGASHARECCCGTFRTSTDNLCHRTGESRRLVEGGVRWNPVSGVE